MMNLERIARDLEESYTQLALARAQSKDTTAKYRSGWIGGYQAMLAEAGYAVATDQYDAPLRPVRLITLAEATTEAPATEEGRMKREQAEERARALGHPLTSWWPSTLYQEAHAACRCGAVTATEFVPYSRDGRGSYVILTEPARAGDCQATNDTPHTAAPVTRRRPRTAAPHNGAATPS